PPDKQPVTVAQGRFHGPAGDDDEAVRPSDPAHVCPLRRRVVSETDPTRTWKDPRMLTTVHAHCDLPCGVYDPAQARIEAQSVKATIEKYNASEDDAFRSRALL